MNYAVLAAIVAGSAALLGSALTGIITYFVSIRMNKLRTIKRKYYQALLDITAFYEIEKLYIDEVAKSSGKSKDSVKKKYREKSRKHGNYSPSRLSQPVHVENELRMLDI